MYGIWNRVEDRNDRVWNEKRSEWIREEVLKMANYGYGEEMENVGGGERRGKCKLKND